MSNVNHKPTPELTPMQRFLLLFLLVPLTAACGSTSGDDGSKTIKITDDAAISDAAGDSAAADVASGLDGDAGATPDVNGWDVQGWPDGIQPDGGLDVQLGDLALEDGFLDDATDQPGDDAIAGGPDVTAWPDGIAPDAGPDAIAFDVLVDVIGIDVVPGQDVATDSGVTDIKSLPDTFGTDTGPDVKVDIATADTGKDTAAPDVQVNCDGPKGCYACQPATNLQLLNQCSDLSSAIFDNKARLPLLNSDGSLPPLP